MQKYSFGGKAKISHSGFFPDSSNENVNWDLKVTESYEIKVFLDHTKDSPDASYKIYHRYYTSAQGFTMGKIFWLINETFIKYTDTNQDPNMFNGTFIESFTFDPETNCVYPFISS
jgi:hypothetical protein